MKFNRKTRTIFAKFASMKERLLGKTPRELTAVALECGLPAFAGKQIARWIYVARVRSIDEMTNLSKAGRAALSDRYEVGVTLPTAVSESADGTRKYLFPVNCPVGAGREEDSCVEEDYCEDEVEGFDEMRAFVDDTDTDEEPAFFVDGNDYIVLDEHGYECDEDFSKYDEDDGLDELDEIEDEVDYDEWDELADGFAPDFDEPFEVIFDDEDDGEDVQDKIA